MVHNLARWGMDSRVVGTVGVETIPEDVVTCDDHAFLSRAVAV